MSSLFKSKSSSKKEGNFLSKKKLANLFTVGKKTHQALKDQEEDTFFVYVARLYPNKAESKKLQTWLENKDKKIFGEPIAKANGWSRGNVNVLNSFLVGEKKRKPFDDTPFAIISQEGKLDFETLNGKTKVVNKGNIMTLGKVLEPYGIKCNEQNYKIHLCLLNSNKPEEISYTDGGKLPVNMIKSITEGISSLKTVDEFFEGENSLAMQHLGGVLKGEIFKELSPKDIGSLKKTMEGALKAYLKRKRNKKQAIDLSTERFVLKSLEMRLRGAVLTILGKDAFKAKDEESTQKKKGKKITQKKKKRKFFSNKKKKDGFNQLNDSDDSESDDL